MDHSTESTNIHLYIVGNLSRGRWEEGRGGLQCQSPEISKQGYACMYTIEYTMYTRHEPLSSDTLLTEVIIKF